MDKNINNVKHASNEVPNFLLNTVQQIDVKYKFDSNGEILLNLEDVAVGLGFTRTVPSADGNTHTYIRWERVKERMAKADIKSFCPDLGKDSYITLSEFYELSSYAESKVAMEFKKKVNTEILPSIFYTGAYVSENATPDQIEHLMENQVLLFYNQGGERAGRRIGQLIDSLQLNNLRIIEAFDYIYERLKNKHRSQFIQSFKYAVDEAYDRALMAGGQKKKLAMEAFRTKAELLFHIERVHHKRDNYSHGQTLRRVKDKFKTTNQI